MVTTLLCLTAAAQTIAFRVPNSVFPAWMSPVQLQERRQYAYEAEVRFRRSGLQDEAALVAILANGWHESYWDPRTIYHETNGTNSVGLFQLNSGGMGRGLSTQDRMDVNNTVYVILTSSGYQTWLEKIKEKKTSGEMAYSFARLVMGCASRFFEPRRITADRWMKELTASPRLLYGYSQTGLTGLASQ